MRLPDGVVAGAVAGALSGAPSTVHALVAGRSALEAVRAAGTLVGRSSVAAGVGVHAAVSLGWGVVLGAVLPGRRTPWWGLAGGLAIAAVDLGVIGRRLPRVRALPVVPQVADHVAYGVVAGAVLSARRSR